MYEVEMKAHIINHLIRKGVIKKGDIILNEFTFSATTRRIDLAFLKENLFVGIEIKSAYDSLHRLSGQLDEYLSFFDKVIVFTSSKHERLALNSLSGSEELLIQYPENTIKLRKRGRTIRSSNKRTYINMMRAYDLSKACNKHKIKPEIRNRKHLEIAAESIPTAKLREYFFESIKKRYASNCASFWQKFKNEVTAKDIALLSRNSIGEEDSMSISSLLRSGKI